MLRYALKAALAKKLRLVSTALSVILGVAFLAGTLVFTDTIRQTFDDLFAGIFEETDSYVRAAESVETEMGEDLRGRIPESVLATVAAVPGVADAQPLVQGFAQLVDAGGDAVGNPGQGPPTLGMSYVGGALSPWELTEGSREPGPGEVVIDAGSAKAADFALGEPATVLTQTGPHEFVVVGTARFGSIDSPGGASVVIFDLPDAQDVLLGGAQEIDAVMVDAADGVREVELTDRIAAVLPDGVEAVTGDEITAEAQDSMKAGLGFFSTFLLVFAAIGLVVASFTIYNTFQIIVTQRIREMAMLRAIGASTRQVLVAQLVEAALIGVVASVIGLAAGVVVAGLLKGLLAAFGIDIPASDIVFQNRTAAVALGVGIVVTIGSAVFPSLRASRIPPLVALRGVNVEEAGASRRRLILGGVVTGLGIAAFVAGLATGEIWWVAFGALFTFIGVFVLGPLIARPVARVLGAPLPAVAGITGALARENAMRNPKRTSRTGGALMVGVALVAAITVIAASAKDWTRDIFGEQFSGDFVVSTDTFGFGGLSPDVAAALNELPEVDAATGVRLGTARIGDEDASYVSVDPSTVGRVFDIGVTDGALEKLTTDGLFVHQGTASSRGLSVGDRLSIQFLNGDEHELTVEGIYAEDSLAGAFVISHGLNEQSGADQFDFSVYVATADGVSGDDAEAAIASVTDEYANAELLSRSDYIDAQAGQVDQLVNLMYGLLGLAVIIALISIANSMALSIHERTHEVGLLRAVGMSRGQTRRAVGLESVLISVLGAGLGVVIGVFFGWSITVTLRDEGLTAVNVPWTSLAIIVALAVLGGILAAFRPARRAARIDVLRAIATE